MDYDNIIKRFFAFSKQDDFKKLNAVAGIEFDEILKEIPNENSLIYFINKFIDDFLKGRKS